MNRSSLILVVILTAFFILAVGYGISNPLFEAPDENMHYFTALYIAENGTLPSVGDELDPWMAQEAAQPPLYYLAASLLLRLADNENAKASVWANPRVQLGDASALANTNTFVHTSQEDWPWKDFVLSAHLLRLFSAFVGVGTLLLIYHSARLVWPERTDLALLAAGLVAFLPQFDFLHGSISNDPIVILLSSAALYQLLRLWFRGITWTALVLLGITIGLAILTKMAGLLLLLFSLLFLTVLIWRQWPNSRRRRLAGFWVATVGLVTLVALGVSGWLLWRNWHLYADITASSIFVQIAGGDRNYSLIRVLREAPSLLNSSIGVFGWMNIRPAGWVYIYWKTLFVVGLGGLTFAIVKGIKLDRSTDGQASLRFSGNSWLLSTLLLLWFGFVLLGLIRFLMQTPAAQGRLIFPAIMPLALGLAYGLSQLRSRILLLLVTVVALISSLYVLLIVIPEAYALPERLVEEDIPPSAQLVDFELGEGIEVVAVQMESDIVFPGEPVWLTLYWKSGDKITGYDSGSSPEYVIELFGHENELIGKLQSYHGNGLYPATLWTAEEIVADQIGIQLIDDMEVPVQARLNLKLANGPSAVDIGTVKIRPHDWPEYSEAAVADFSGIQIAKASLGRDIVQAGGAVPIYVRWQVETAPEQNLTTFVHLGDQNETPLAQGDSPPLQGAYPTILWEVGEVIDDNYEVVIPDGLEAGRYPIYIGLYDPISGIRRPLNFPGELQLNDAFLVGWVTVSEEP